MRTKPWLIAVLALAIAAPVAAQDAGNGGSGIWAPWATTTEAPAPKLRPRPAAPAIVAEAPRAETLANRLMRIDRFWVIGSFR